MNRLVSIILILAFCAGCATTEKRETVPPPKPPAETRKAKPVPKKREQVQIDRGTASKRLAKAVDLLEAGETAGAVKILGGIVAAKGIPGVTDEALFRLALLTLKPSSDAPASRRGRHLLRRLKEEYPSSSWTAQAAPLLEMISAEDELRQQNRNLKSTNQALNKKINELNANIEQLKHLDLELEQKR